MSYKILPTEEFSKDFEKLDPAMRLRAKAKIAEAADEPERCKHLHYELAGNCRIRVGKLRVIFSYDNAKREMYLKKIVFGHRY
jgi:mRNA-degrading endonuclease RelE of RelBE toxin-antitoxin system